MRFSREPQPSSQDSVEELRKEIHRLSSTVDRLASLHEKDAERLKNLSRILEERHRSDEEWRRQVDDRIKADLKWRQIIKYQLMSVVRRLCLPLDQMRPPYDLAARRVRLRSQNEEDGILLALLERTGWGGQRFVEIGSGKSGGNAAVLAHDCGWSGLMIDSKEDAVVKGRQRFSRNPGVTFVAARVMPETVNQLLAEHGYTGEVDLLSIDIDSYDYWVLQALEVCSPRVLMVEYNALFGAERRVTIPLTQPMEGTPKGYGGASLKALAGLAQRKRYRLVACEDSGVNAFFLRDDVAPDVRAISVVEAYRPLRRIDREDGEAEVAIDIFDTVARMKLPLVEV